MIKKEGEIMKKLNHPNILKCFDFLSSSNNYYFITEICLDGDLQEFVTGLEDEKMDEEEAFQVIV